MKTFTAYTSEIDDVELAVSEILEQLDLGKLEKNSVGIISCYSEFIDTGVVKTLSERLPFKTVGITTMECAVPGVISEMALTLMVLSDDNAIFSVGLTEPLLSGDDAPIRTAYETASEGHSAKPSLIISFAPLLMNFSGDFYIESMDNLSGGVPNFGTLAIDHTSDYHESRVICGGDAFPDRYAFILVYGNIQPRFFVGTISDEKVFREKGAVTGSRGNLIETVNGMPVADYLLTLGLTKDENGNIIGINTFPFVADYNDGTPRVIRVAYAMTPDGCAVCGGNVPIGATLSVGSIDAEEIIATSTAAIEEALSADKSNGILIFSCIGRYFAQGYSPDGEAKMIASRLDGVAPYFFTCSGGELCPVSGDGGALKNRNHNDSIAICIF